MSLSIPSLACRISCVCVACCKAPESRAREGGAGLFDVYADCGAEALGC